MQYHEFLKKHRKVKFIIALALLAPIAVLMVLDALTKGGRAFLNKLGFNLRLLIDVYSRL